MLKKFLVSFLITVVLILGIFTSSSYLKTTAASGAINVADIVLPEPDIIPTPIPDPNDKYFSDQEKYFVADDYSYMSYSSKNLSVEITRCVDKERTLRYYVADVRTRNGESFFSGYPNHGTPNMDFDSRRRLNVIARQYSAVLAINGDFYIDNKNNTLGIIIREGEIKVEKNKADTLAFMPDGSLKVYSPGEVTGQELLGMGVNMTYSFGPTLVKDGQMTEGLDRHRLRSRNPRTGIGYIDKDHYILIVVEGRRPGISVGVTLTEFAELFLEQGATLAYNLDGGISSNMCFLGNPLAYHPVDEIADHCDGRSLPDMIYIGVSDLCADEDDEIIRYGQS
ncbi:MAG: phosphodiester glycosidase family protein [Eubacteriales bacterium]